MTGAHPGGDSAPRVTRYRVPRRRRGAGRVAVAVVAALLVVLAAGAAALFARQGDGEPTPMPQPSPALSARAVADGRVEVRTGKIAVLRCCVEGECAVPLSAVLEVRTKDGERVARVALRSIARPGSTLLYRWRADVAPGTYRYRVLLEDASGEAELSSKAAPLVVTQPPGFPSEAAVEKALAWAATRLGRVSVAVVDTNGRLYGLDEHSCYRSASLVKAMLLVQYLRMHPEPDPSMDDVLRLMIVESNNACADVVFREVGQEGLQRLADRVGMKDFAPAPYWITSQISAADQARFFLELESHVPKQRREFVREVLSGIVPRQRWGIVAASGPLGWETYFKAGWLNPNNFLVVQAAWLERGERRFSLAVLTDGNPEWTCGFSTIKGVTGILLGQEPTPGYLSQVLQP